MQVEPRSKSKRAVVIGSGFGGLAAAGRLGAGGWDVSGLERHDQPGGRARAFRQGGCTFDAATTVIAAPLPYDAAIMAHLEHTIIPGLSSRFVTAGVPGMPSSACVLDSVVPSAA